MKVNVQNCIHNCHCFLSLAKTENGFQLKNCYFIKYDLQYMGYSLRAVALVIDVLKQSDVKRIVFQIGFLTFIFNPWPPHFFNEGCSNR